MNATPTEQLEAVTGALLLPLPVAAQLLGLSLPTARRDLPIVAQGYRTKAVSVASIRSYIAKKEQTQQPKFRIVKP
jgi:hypothetical protein